MRHILLILSLFGISMLQAQQTIYNFSATPIDATSPLSLKAYKGKVVLIVNTASKCGYTPQYEGLEKLYEQFKDRGLVILGFPCNQFGNQEPGSNAEIAQFCTANYHVSFPMFERIDVNGDNAHPLYRFLKETLADDNGKKDIRWNFTKFLIDRQGFPVKRYASGVKPADLVADIEAQITQGN